MKTIFVYRLVMLLSAIWVLVSSAPCWAVRNGSVLNPGDFPAVGQLWSPTLSSGNCTATLISSREIITAAHCVKGNENRPEVFAFSLVGVTAKIQHITVRSIPFWQDQDLAILALDKDITNFKLPRVQMKPLTEITALTVVGFGVDHDGDSFGTKRSGTIELSGQFKAGANSQWSGIAMMLSAQPGESNQLACPGDSGGPIFKYAVDGTLDLIGIVQGSPIQNPSKPCDTAQELLITPLSEHAQWIRSIFEK